MSSQLSVEKVENSWAIIHLPQRSNLKFAYVPSNHLIKINTYVEDWVSTAELFIGTPYKWGGRDSLGIDCSALLQLSYQNYGKKIPRNSDDQVKIKMEKINEIEKLERGCVIFWKGHLGIMTSNFYCLHANAFHIITIKEPLIKINERMGEKNKIIKMMNFN